jgi:hypothetical protein
LRKIQDPPTVLHTFSQQIPRTPVSDQKIIISRRLKWPVFMSVIKYRNKQKDLMPVTGFSSINPFSIARAIEIDTIE